MASARFKELYLTTIKPQLKKELELDSIMEVPKITKIVLNVGVKEAVADSKVLQYVMQIISQIAGQAPVRKLAKKSIAGFKIREKMPIGVMVTLRGNNMYEFLDKLVNVSLPKVRDFQGIGTKFDGRGNYNLGIRDWSMFPETDITAQEKSHGLNITICTSTKDDMHAHALLKSFGMPFRKK